MADAAMMGLIQPSMAAGTAASERYQLHWRGQVLAGLCTGTVRLQTRAFCAAPTRSQIE
jgi:hypothetical protein